MIVKFVAMLPNMKMFAFEPKADVPANGKDRLPEVTISEQAAIKAARAAAAGDLNEVDLEHYQRRLVFNVDVGGHDVKVDPANGNVLASGTSD